MNKRVAIFDARWRSNWGDESQPIGWWLRGRASTWSRFHTLPNSKRYADSEIETQEILNRHSVLLREAAGGETSDFVVIAQDWGDDGPHQTSALSWLPQATKWRSRVFDDEEYNLPNLWISFGPHTVDELLPLLRAVADDQLKLLVTNASATWAYAPYDGGADIFYRNELQRSAARDNHRDWLSAHPLGL